MTSNEERKYKIVVYVRMPELDLGADGTKGMTLEEAQQEVDHLYGMQPENVYEIQPLPMDS